MIVAGFDGGVRIELDDTEMAELADFLQQFYENDGSVSSRLSAKLDEILQRK